MNYVSTRNNNIKVSSPYAIAHGISTEGGLYVPENIPQLTKSDIANLLELDYIGKAECILKKYLTDFTDEEIAACVKGAYTGSFDDEKLEGTLTRLPLREEMPAEIDESFIVEFYNR